MMHGPINIRMALIFLPTSVCVLIKFTNNNHIRSTTTYMCTTHPAIQSLGMSFRNLNVLGGVTVILLTLVTINIFLLFPDVDIYRSV